LNHSEATSRNIATGQNFLFRSGAD